MPADPALAIDRRTLLGAGLAALSIGPGAIARTPPSAMKFMSLLVRKAGIDEATFRHEWLDVHAPQARAILNMRGFVLSEVVPPRPAGPAPVFTNLGEIAGVSTSWWDSGESRDAARRSPEMQAWVEHGNTILDRGRSLSLTLREQVFRRPAAAGGIKRIGLMRRRAGTSHDDCIRYWMDVHAPMYGRVPGLRGFAVSECTAGGDAAGIDGVVETWWDSVEARAAALATPAGRAWNTDGRLFLDIPASAGVFVRDRRIIPPPPWL